MKKVVCINDKNLPQGAEVVNGREYYVVDEFVNNFEGLTPDYEISL